MQTGLGILGHGPAVFWAMTPKELAAAITALSGETEHQAPLSSTGLNKLMERFPDHG